MALEDVAHIVVLMLENRSFDCMLGRLYPKSANFAGLDGTEFNLDKDPDPGELYTDMNEQIFGTQVVPDPPVPTMSGFVTNLSGRPPSRHIRRKT